VPTCRSSAIGKPDRLGSALLVGQHAFANCAPPPDVPKAFLEAKAVYLAKAIDVKTERCPGDTTGRCKIEYATLQVIEAWKGAKQGDQVKVRTVLETGETSSVYQEVEEADTGKILRGAGIWLIYQYSPEPIQLDACGWSKPIEFGGANDLATLYRLKATSDKYK
jgi:hypothetical protein